MFFPIMQLCNLFCFFKARLVFDVFLNLSRKNPIKSPFDVPQPLRKNTLKGVLHCSSTVEGPNSHTDYFEIIANYSAGPPLTCT